ncbi:MAG: PrsW family glutamic-type intramembrane protease [Bacteroidota bacterium]
MDLPILGLTLGLIPVLLFLVGLRYLDSFKLVRLRDVLITLFVGACAAGLSFLANRGLTSLLELDWDVVSRYVAPAIEEQLKGAFLLYLIVRGRVGFMVDAAIRGFAIGAGFALVENIHYMQALPDAAAGVWVVRGLGTAIMHGGTTAIIGIMAKTFLERTGAHPLLAGFPGLFTAIILHSVFNHFLLSPGLSTLVVLIVFPLAVIFVFNRSEQSTRVWLGVGFDTDQELLEMITSGELAGTRIGRYLQTLERKFPPAVVADMLCYLRVHLELTIQAKGVLLMRDAGFEVQTDPELKEKFEELRYLDKSIGKTGILALRPFLHSSTHDLWQLYILESK